METVTTTTAKLGDEATTTNNNNDAVVVATTSSSTTEVLLCKKPIPSTTLLYQMGGEENLERCVSYFYKLVLKDKNLRPFFDGVNASRLKRHQMRFLYTVFTTLPDEFDYIDFLVEKHERLFVQKGLTVQHFDLTVTYLIKALKRSGCVPDNDNNDSDDSTISNDDSNSNSNSNNNSNNRDKNSNSFSTTPSQLLQQVAQIMTKFRKAFENGKQQVQELKQKKLEKDNEILLSSPQHSKNRPKLKLTDTLLCKNVQASSTLLYRMGGEENLEACIEHFYELILQDESLSKFFVNIKMDRLKRHQQRFLYTAFTSTNNNNDFDYETFLVEKHKRLFEMGLNVIHFDKVVNHLVSALESLWIEIDVIQEVKILLNTKFRPVFEQYSQQQQQQKNNGNNGLLLAPPLTHDNKNKTTLDTKQNNRAGTLWKKNLKPSETLLFRMGGEPNLEICVDIFYDFVLGDEELAPFFERVKMSRLKSHQMRFLYIAFTEFPQDFDVIDYLKRRHKHMMIEEHHYDKLIGYMFQALESMWIEKEVIDDVRKVMRSFRPAFVLET